MFIFNYDWMSNGRIVSYDTHASVNRKDEFEFLKVIPLRDKGRIESFGYVAVASRLEYLWKNCPYVVKYLDFLLI